MNLFDRPRDVAREPGPQGFRGTRAWAYARAGLTLGIVLGAGAVGTMAAWSDSATATSGTFSAGTPEVLELRVYGDAPVHQFTTLRRSSMLRGQSVAGALDVQNTGTLDFNWSISAGADGSQDLINVLQVGLFHGQSNNGTTCTGSQIGSTETLSASPTLASGRSLASGANERICVQVTVRSDAGIAARFEVAEPIFTIVAVRA